MRRFCHHRPGSGLLSDHHDPGEIFVYRRIELLQKLSRSDILVPAVFVGDPFALFPPVIQIKHGRDSIHPDAIHMVFLKPEYRIGNKETPDLITIIVEYQGTPVGVLTLAGIQMLIQRCSVKSCKSVSILREMGRYPVNDYADAVAVALIDQVHEILRASVAAGD